jgi:polyisoprenoid-binding protein YceI
MNLVKSFVIGAMVLGSTVTAMGAVMSFKVGGHPARQLAIVESVADFETFTGKTNKITGSLSFDVAKKTGSGKIEVDLASLETGIAMRDEHFRSARWFDTTKNPTAVFETTKVQHVRGDNYKVTGKFTLKGVTKTITTDATVRYRPESDATKKAGFKGDVLQVTTKFKVKLSDFGITDTSIDAGKVANEVTISVTAFGTQG